MIVRRSFQFVQYDDLWKGGCACCKRRGMQCCLWCGRVRYVICRRNALIQTIDQPHQISVKVAEPTWSLTNHGSGTRWRTQWSALGFLREEKTLARATVVDPSSAMSLLRPGWSYWSMSSMYPLSPSLYFTPNWNLLQVWYVPWHLGKT